MMKNQMIPYRKTIIWGDDQPLQTLHIVDDIMLVRNNHLQMNEESF